MSSTTGQGGNGTGGRPGARLGGPERGHIPHRVDDAPFEPAEETPMTPEQERLYRASQWRMMWWKLKRHRLAVAARAIARGRRRPPPVFRQVAHFTGEFASPGSFRRRTSATSSARRSATRRRWHKPTSLTAVAR